MQQTPEPLAGLIREHRLIEATISTAVLNVRAAAAVPDDSERVASALVSLSTLHQFLEHELALHIQKEEEILFPVLRNQTSEIEITVEDMLGEHEKVRVQSSQLQQAIASLGADHGAVADACARLSEMFRSTAGGEYASGLAQLSATVVQLDWILQGHFTAEEDGVFTPAEDVLSSAVLAEMALRMGEISPEIAYGGQSG
jgi:hemerythrin-like domain-containing protein